MSTIFNWIKEKVGSKNTFKKGREHTLNALVEWHQRLADRQKELDRTFSLDHIESFSVNVFDDYDADSGENTYAYVAMRDVPDRVCCDILLHILNFARSNPTLSKAGVRFGFRFHDSSEFYPILIGDVECPEQELSMCKQWEIIIEGASYNTLRVVVKELKKVQPFRGKMIKVYSES